MICLEYKSGPFGDGTSFYNVKTDAISVHQFIEQVLKERSNEWGEICLVKGDGSKICVCEYRYGGIARKATEYDSYGIARIKSISANGGWTAMSYDIQVENGDEIPKQTREEFLQVYFGFHKR